MSAEEEPPESKKLPRQDPMYELACLIKNGVSGRYIYCIEQNRFYIYEEGYWRSVFEVELMDAIITALPMSKKFSIATRKQILENLKVLAKCRLDKLNADSDLNLVNGLLNPWGGALEKHRPENLSTIRLNYKFDPENTCDLWLRTINQILENDADKINMLQEFFGYCLTRDTRMEKALLLLGESRAGKSVILHTLRALLGDNNCSSIPIKYLSNPSYTSMLMNKLINIDTDVSGKAQDFEAEFKTITSGEPVACSPKYVPTFEFKPYCKLVMAANIFPRITDHSSAFYKRLVLIPCDRVFEEHEINRDLKHELTEELPGILNWALAGLRRMNSRNGFLQHDFMKEAVESLREESNPTEVFFREHIAIAQGAETEKGFLYLKYKEWCKASQPDGYVLSMIKFSQCVYQKYSKSTPKNTMSHTLMKRIWRNLKYVDDKHAPVKEAVQWQE